jgi:hypothetical protein
MAMRPAFGGGPAALLEVMHVMAARLTSRQVSGNRCPLTDVDVLDQDHMCNCVESIRLARAKCPLRVGLCGAWDGNREEGGRADGSSFPID